MGAVMVLAMHAGFAFLEVGTVRLKNQVNALSKIITDFAVSTLAYFFIGYWIAYGVTFMQPADQLVADHGYALVKFFFLLTFAAAIPAIISGGIACGIFGQAALGGLGGVSLISQVIGSGLGMLVALVGGFGVYGLLKHSMGIRLSQEEEFNGADLSIHRIGALSHD